MPQGRENIILLKEGGMGKGSFVLASLFSFRSKRSSDDGKSIVILNDITPRLPHLKAIVDFPFRPLYGQAIKLQRQPEQLLLQAADVEFSWDKSLAPKALEFWKYDRPSRKFVPANNVSAIPVMTIQ